MAPHLTLAEQDSVRELFAKGKSSSDINSSISKSRAKRGIAIVNITAVRRYMSGRSHKRGPVETRGRKRTFSRRNVLAMDIVRRAPVTTSIIC